MILLDIVHTAQSDTISLIQYIAVWCGVISVGFTLIGAFVHWRIENVKTKTEVKAQKEAVVLALKTQKEYFELQLKNAKEKFELQLENLENKFEEYKKGYFLDRKQLMSDIKEIKEAVDVIKGSIK